MPQHPADGFNRHSGFQRNQRGEGMTCLMIAQGAAHPCEDSKRFHVLPKIRMPHHREQCRAVVIMVFLNQGECFRQQFHACLKLVLLAAVFKPKVSIVIRVQIIPCYAHRIRIGSARIAGKQEEVTHKDVRGAACRYLHIAYLLEILAAQGSWSAFTLFWQGEIGEMASFGISLLVSYAAYLFKMAR